MTKGIGNWVVRFIVWLDEVVDPLLFRWTGAFGRQFDKLLGGGSGPYE